MKDAPQPGLYGKLPLSSDAVALRKLPKSFVVAWQRWLNAGLAAGERQCGTQWPERFQQGPVWRFGLSAGVCGDSAWAGVMLPSWDAAGALFPLTLAVPLPPTEPVQQLFERHGAWFGALERLAVAAVREGWPADTVEQRLARLPTPRLAGQAADAAPSTFLVGMHDLQAAQHAFAGLAARIFRRFLPLPSVWMVQGSGSLFICEGLPPAAAFAAMLTGTLAGHGRAVPVQSDAEGALPCAADATVRLSQLAAHWQWRSWGVCVVGQRRSLNEDNLLQRDAAGLWLVADGMGGHQAGDVASQAIVDALASLAALPSLLDFADAVRDSLRSVNARLCKLAGGGGQIIGSTVVALLARADRCVFLWAGDSRLYRYRDGQLQQLSRDHSLFADLQRQGIMTAEEVAQQGHSDVITRAVGADASLQLEAGECQALPGDLFLLCSDGLDKELSPAEIAAIFQQQPVEQVAGALVAQAEARGARDNVTVLVVQVQFIAAGL